MRALSLADFSFRSLSLSLPLLMSAFSVHTKEFTEAGENQKDRHRIFKPSRITQSIPIIIVLIGCRTQLQGSSYRFKRLYGFALQLLPDVRGDQEGMQQEAVHDEPVEWVASIEVCHTNVGTLCIHCNVLDRDSHQK